MNVDIIKNVKSGFLLDFVLKETEKITQIMEDKSRSAMYLGQFKKIIKNLEKVGILRVLDNNFSFQCNVMELNRLNY